MTFWPTAFWQGFLIGSIVTTSMILSALIIFYFQIKRRFGIDAEASEAMPTAAQGTDR